MKSPWKFVAQLMSGRRTQDDLEDKLQLEGNESSSKKALKALPAPGSDALLERELRLPGDARSTEIVDQTSSVEVESAVPASVSTSTAAATETDPGISDGPATLKQTRKLRSVQRDQPSKHRVIAGSGENETAQNEQTPSAPLESVGPVAEEAGLRVHSVHTGNALTDLDNEIWALRSLLSEKLRQQNTQLRAMLKRYES